ncbi:hypothetical protein N0V85_007677 [Neurospora sp. IMI 360204]|nr:hypothetical protein N0V85_007677 [Neurospora sp. IMI 360204]
MVTGYPRFFIPRVVERLAERLLGHFTQAHSHQETDIDLQGKHALILSTAHHALMCRQLFRQKLDPDSPNVNFDILIAHWDGTITAIGENDDLPSQKPPPPLGQEDIFLLPYPVDMVPVAKSFLQHTGFGISSRRATTGVHHATPTPFDEDTNAKAISAIRTRLANCYSTPTLPVPPSNVFLYPTGMSSIAAISLAIKSLVLPKLQSNGKRPPSVALFGFLYVDTLKLLSNLLGFTLHLYPFSTPLSSSLSDLLSSGKLEIDLLITEFPGNPLLKSPDLTTLYHLSQKYGFALVVDDTVGGTGANVNVLRKCDAVVSSLTKMASGGCDVMGGCLVLNPDAAKYVGLRETLEGGRKGEDGTEEGVGSDGQRDLGYGAELEVDGGSEGQGGELPAIGKGAEVKVERKEETERSWFPADIAVMERNSRDFIHRVRKASSNAEWLVHNLLRPHTSVQEVYYPKGSSTEGIYEQFRVKPTADDEGEGGYSFLVSIKFQTPAMARAFYDALDVAKGPSLGTNFTLCCAYTLLSHYRELEWAAEFGVVEDLVRISVGLEENEWLGERVGRALKAAGECEG